MEDFNITNELFKIQKLGYEREEQFVTLINSLSGSIKNYMKSFVNIEYFLQNLNHFQYLKL